MIEKEFWNKTWRRPYGRYNAHHQAVWNEILPLVKGRVVDLGCGPCMIYKGTDADLTGVDSSEEAIAQAKINYPQGSYIVADARSTNLPSNSFDTVIMLGLLDYFENWEDVLLEARRIKKPEGKIIATLLNGFMGHDWKSPGIYKHITSNWYLYTE